MSVEGYDDDGEEGAGEKLALLLCKLGFVNIVVMVCLWHDKLAGSMGINAHSIIVNQAKVLADGRNVIGGTEDMAAAKSGDRRKRLERRE